MEPIAIVGMSCRFPGEASNISGFWDMLINGRDTWSDFPSSRFNAKAFYHPDNRHHGTFHTRGGCFLAEDVSQFDAPFFHLNPAEATAMDPQLRLLLEVAYEAVENAGWSLDMLRGRNTSVYTALYNYDYEKILFRDPESLPFYLVTGNGEAMHSNRLSYFFDLHGPSVTLDTGCSGSMVALQNACDSIRSGECTESIVGSTSLILDPAAMVAPSFLNLYGADGRSYAFDHRAEGYGRGEGVACLVLKSVSEAIKDGDPVRAVIRGIGLGQDGLTQGITAPSPHAQKALIEKIYERESLDFSKTVYVEAHGSGTVLGDEVESSTLATLATRYRKNSQKPLYIGSVKTNIGHLESASGLAGLIKSVLILENRLIPPSLSIQTPNKHIDGTTMMVPSGCIRLAELGSSQISVNSFGYGGTNGHVVIDAFDKDRTIPPDRCSDISQSQSSTKEVILRLRGHLERQSHGDSHDYMKSLVYTLCQRRSLFSWRATIIADTVSEFQRQLTEPGPTFRRVANLNPRIIFAFTGQGSQWHAMGRELLHIYSVFKRSIELAEQILTGFGAIWKLQEELRRDKNTCQLYEAKIAQPSIVAIQLALVDLLGSWNVWPDAVIGHSSGEIAAAYACNAVSFHDALLTAYARGMAANKLANNAGHYISKVPETPPMAMRIACVNSPESVTVAGDDAADGVFLRKLPVNVAYHSHHMSLVADDYSSELSALSLPSRSEVQYFSTADGQRIETDSLDAKYWVKNLTNPVQFAEPLQQAFSSLTEERECNGMQQARPDTIIVCEIGPHSALKGPIHESLGNMSSQGIKFHYIPTLIRNQEATETMLSLAGQMLCAGVEIDLKAVNFGGSQEMPPCLTDPPAYPWDHSTSYWHESRISRSYRQRQHPPHPLLGVLAPESNALDLRWRNYISSADPELAWLSGHVVDGRMIFPAAGYVCMAHEALTQYMARVTPGSAMAGIRLSGITMSQPLIVPDSRDGVEVVLSFRPSSDQPGRDLSMRHEFVIMSFDKDDTVIEHCRGFVAQLPMGRTPYQSISALEVQDKTTSNIDATAFYDRLWKVGNQFTGPFRGLSKIEAGPGTSVVQFEPLSRFTEVAKYRHLHPVTLDLCFQSLIPAIQRKEGIDRPIMPTAVKDLILASQYKVSCQVKKIGHGEYKASINVNHGNREGRSHVENERIPRQIQRLIHTPDPALLRPDQVISLCRSSLGRLDRSRSQALSLVQACVYYASCAVMKPHQLRYFQWLEKGASSRFGLRPVNGLQDGSYEGQMVSRLGRNMTRILRGECEPISLMTEENLLHNIYRYDEEAQRCAVQGAELVRLLGMKNPNLAILEALDSGNRLLSARYTFTDISAGFFPQAMDLLAKWRHIMDFRGFEKDIGTYDVVVAANTMAHVCQLLKPGGRLILLEKTLPRVHDCFIFGTLSGWWYGSVQRNKDHPLLTVDEWDTTLKEASFTGVDTCLQPYENTEEQGTSLIISSKNTVSNISFDGAASIVLTRQQFEYGDQDLAHRIAGILAQSPPFSADEIHILDAEKELGAVCVFLAGLDNEYWDKLDSDSFDALKSTLQRAKQVIWVTRGATDDCKSPHAALSSGFFRSLRREHSDRHIVHVDLDSDPLQSDKKAADTLVSFVNHFCQMQDVIEDTEFIERNGQWLVPRLVPDRASTDFVYQLADGELPAMSQLETIPLRDRTVQLVADAWPWEVEIDVKATGLYFRDRMILLGELKGEFLGECSGVILGVGDQLKKQFKPGDRVYSWGVPCHSSRVRARGFLSKHIPSFLSFAEAAALPIVNNTAYYFLVNVARLKPGEKILIHAGAGGVGQAAIALALSIGATVFATVGSEEKRKFLMDKFGLSSQCIFSSRTDGTGVDVVLNSLSGSLLQDPLDIMAPFGRFIEIGKRDIHAGARIAMTAMEHNISVTCIDLTELMQYQPVEAAQVASNVHELISGGPLKPPRPIQTYPVSEIRDAFRQFQGGFFGKIVLSFDADDTVQIMRQTETPMQLDPNSTYLIVGGQGGLGRAVCAWMAQHGAANIVILSPSGAGKPSTQLLIEELAAKGTRLLAIPCDAANPKQLRSALDFCRQAMPPIRGVIQAALQLKSSLFDNMTYDKFATVVTPKTKGTVLLHDNLEDQPLDFFVIFSSMAGLVGNIGDSHYAAASTFQDAFARWRTEQGYPTRSINIGPVLEVGYTHEHQDVKNHLEAEGMEPIPLDRFLALVEYAMSRPIGDISGVQLGVGLSSKLEASSPLANTPMFSHLRYHTSQSSHKSENGNTGSDKPEDMLRTALVSEDAPERSVANVEEAFLRYISALTGIPLSYIDPARSVVSHGGDSLVVVEFRNWLRKGLGPHFGTGKNIGQMSIRDLSMMALETVRVSQN
ncbi:hypothetical protein BJX96DRAFT_185048 [Aspergillus floccosus]